MNQVLRFLDEAPVTVLLGACQTGKTTLAQMVADVFESQQPPPMAVVVDFDRI
jgi:predicted AAA+ superfamily ATPase